MVVGGVLADTYYYDIDYFYTSSSQDSIVGVGQTSDTGIVGAMSIPYPIISLYNNGVLQFHSYLSETGSFYYGAFSTDGLYVIAHKYQSPGSWKILIIDAITPNLVRAEMTVGYFW